MDTKLARLLSGTAPVLLSFILSVLTLLGCSSPSAPTTPTDDGFVPADVSAPDTREDATPSDTTDADARSDDAGDTPVCVQGQKCIELGKFCGSLVCTPCGLQNAMSACDAGVGDADAPSDADAGDTLDSTPPVDSSDTADTSPPDTGAEDTPLPDTGTPDTGPGDTDASDVADTTPPPDTAVDTGPADTGPLDTGPADSIVTDVFDTGTPDTGPGDADADAEAEAPPPDTGSKPLKCATPKRNALFDGLLVGGGPIEDVGQIWGTGECSVYVPTQHGGEGAVKRWNCITWSEESFPVTPNGFGAIWGANETDVWYASVDSSTATGVLLHKMGSTWKESPTKPKAKKFVSLTGASSTELFLAGNNPSWIYTVWKGDSTSWTTLPPLPSSDWFTAGQLFAGGSGRVAVGGYDINDTTFKEERVAVYVYDGVSTWTKYQSPLSEKFVLAGGIHGTSLDEMWIAGRTDTLQGKVCKFSKPTTWSCYVSSGTTAETKADYFAAVFSPWTGAVVVGGGITPLVAGAGRLMTIDAFTPAPITSSIDATINSVSSIWHATGSKQYYLNQSKGSTGAGFYSFTCD